MKNKKKIFWNIGLILICLSPPLGILDFLGMEPEGWEWEITILTVVTALTGLVLVVWARKKQNTY
jgi:hypothetical protein